MAKKKPAERNASNPSAFKAAVKNVGVKTWQKARKEAPRPSFGELIPRGRYEAKLSKAVCSDQDFKLSIGKGKTQTVKIPVVRFNFLITSGDYKGANVSKWISIRPEEVEYSEYDRSDLSETLQNLGKEVESTDLSAVPDLVEELNSEQPGVMIYCDINEYTNKQGEQKKNQRVRVNGLLEEGASEASEEEEANDTEEVDVASLAEIADDEDNAEHEDARNQLTEIAEQFEIDPDKYETWSDVADAITAASEESEGETEEETEEEAEEEEQEEEEEEEEKPAPKKPAAKKPVAKQPVKKPTKKKGTRK